MPFVLCTGHSRYELSQTIYNSVQSSEWHAVAVCHFSVSLFCCVQCAAAAKCTVKVRMHFECICQSSICVAVAVVLCAVNFEFVFFSSSSAIQLSGCECNSRTIIVVRRTHSPRINVKLSIFLFRCFALSLQYKCK